MCNGSGSLSSVRWIFRAGSLALAAFIGYVIGMRGWALFFSAWIGMFVTGFWLVAVIRLLGVRIPMELK